MAPRSGPLKNLNILVIFPLSSLPKEWTRDKMSSWIENTGGTLHKTFADDTTHVVCEEKAWRNDVMAVQQAKERGKEVKIVSPSWLEDCLREQRKAKEGAYLWEKLAQGSKTTASENDGPRSVPGLMGEVFTEATESYLSERDRRRLEAEAEGRERVRRELEAEEKQKQERAKRLEAEKKRQEALERKRAARKGRSENFAEHHHVYKDTTGFSYEVTLTKVDTTRNVNERITLTVFESNAQPHTYATNLYFAGTARKPQNNILAAIGTNFSTAFRLFRKAFRERSGVDWDDRIKAHNERVKARNQPEESAVEFETRPFQYVPPGYGARGLLPKGGSTWQPDTVVLDPEPEVVGVELEGEEVPRESVEGWMSGAVQDDAGAERGQDTAVVNGSATAGVDGQTVLDFGESAAALGEGFDMDSFLNDINTGVGGTGFDFSGQGQQQFDFGGDANVALGSDFMAAIETEQGKHKNYTFSAPGSQLPFEVPNSEPSFPTTNSFSQPGQTQMAEQMGQEFLDFGDGASTLGKRKREDEVEAEAEAEYGD